MTGTAYLHMDIDKLFEEHTIREVEEIRKKIQMESERKKIELRTLVGERYRDLIVAADTIGKMTLTSGRVVSRITDIEDKFRELQKKYLIGFRIKETNKDHHRNSGGASDSIIVQIKILMDIPERIWSSIERKDLLFGTQLYLVGQHINYSLCFEVGDARLSTRYPIVRKQWEVVGQFKNILLAECEKALRSLDVQPESVANSLAALVLLNGTSFTKLLKKLISLRSCAIESVVLMENDSSVKSRVKQCITILIQTVGLIYSCFANTDHGGLVLRYVKAVQEQEAFSLFYRLDSNEEPESTFLPPVTKCHKPFVRDMLEELSPGELRKCVESWLKWVEQFCERHITRLLDLIVSVKGLYYVREEAIGIRIPENWNRIWEELDLPRTCFWMEYLQPIITGRAKSIVNDRWAESLEKLKSDVVELLDRVMQDKCEFPEHDLRWFVWRDSPSDIPQKLAKNGGLDGKRCLLMKAKGFSPSVSKLCESFDRSLCSLLTDLEQYLYETERDGVSSMSAKESLLPAGLRFLISDTFSDRAELQEHLQAVSARKIEELVRFVKVACATEKPEHGQREVNVIVMARFLSALTMLSPNLNKCFTLSKVSGLNITNLKWQSVCERLKEESTALWSVWADAYKAKVREHKDKYVAKESSDDLRMRLNVSEWERVTIEEDSGEGNRIKSEILVPYQPSIQLQKFLTAINKDLNKIIPHTVPKRVLQEIVEDVVTELLAHYSTVAEDANLSEKRAFQVLFDIKYSTLLMVQRDNKALSEISSKACDGILGKIDPFDYDVFEPFILTNVRKSVQRSMLILGNLVPHLEQLHSVLGARTEYTSGEGVIKSEPPSMLALSTGAPWFPPLTVTAPPRSLPLVSTPLTVPPDKTQRKRGTTKESGRSDSAGATIKSGAAAFFGAMGTDWFGGS